MLESGRLDTSGEDGRDNGDMSEDDDCPESDNGCTCSDDGFEDEELCDFLNRKVMSVGEE